MGRGWTITAAVLAFLHAGTCVLGAIGMGLTADRADPMGVDEVFGVAVAILAVALALVVTAILLLVGHAWPVVWAAGSSLLISLYVAVRWAGEPDAYQIPLAYAVLPTAVVTIVGVRIGRRRAGVVTA